MCVFRGVILLGLLPAPGCCPDGPPSCEPGTQQTWCWCEKLLTADGHTDTSASTTGSTSSTQSPTSGGTTPVDTTSGSLSTTSSDTSGETLALETTDTTTTTTITTITTSGEASTAAEPEPCCGEQHPSAQGLCDVNAVAKEGLIFAYRLSLTERCLAGNISITVDYGEIDAVLSDTSDMIINVGIFDDSMSSNSIWWSEAWTISQKKKVDPSAKEWIVPLGMDPVPKMLPSTVWLALRFKHDSGDALCLPASEDHVGDAESVKLCPITGDPMDLQATLAECTVPNFRPDPPRYLAFSLTGDCSS